MAVSYPAYSFVYEKGSEPLIRFHTAGGNVDVLLSPSTARTIGYHRANEGDARDELQRRERRTATFVSSILEQHQINQQGTTNGLESPPEQGKL